MQLKIRRSQKTKGMMSKNVMFCLDARAELTPEEAENVRKYKLGSMVIYNSAKSEKYLNAAAGASDTAGGTLKHMAALAMHRLSLNISIDSLCEGHHIECKDLDELLGAEEAVMQGCNLLKTYLETAQTFDGREEVIDFDEPEQQVAAA